MFSLLVFLVILGVLIIVHEFGHFIIAKKVGVRVEQFSLGFGPVICKKKKGDTEYSLSLFPLGGFVKLAGDTAQEATGKPDEYLSKTKLERAGIVFFGPLLNYVLGFLLLWFICFAGYPTLTTKVGTTIEGLGARDAGIKAGDKIVAVNGVRVGFWEDLQKAVHKLSGGTVVKISVLRDNKEKELNVVIKTKDLNDPLGKKHNVGLLGITPDDEIVSVRHGFFNSFIVGAKKTWELTSMTYTGLWRMITGQLSVRDSVTGPLGIFYITSKAASLGIIAVMHLVAVLSISLGIFNLLPLPILDGGHILFLGLEKLRGKALGVKTEQVITNTGITLLIMLALFVTYNDFMRFFGDKISKFFVK